MAEDKWIEIKREFEIDSEGKYKLSKVTQELDKYRKKEKIDLFIRWLSLLAIPIAILTFAFNKKTRTKEEVENLILDNIKILC